MSLQREVGLPGAIMMGLGSIIGTGVFVSIAIAAEVARADVILAIAIAAAVATCNAMSSAQLAASHPVSGGTYEYGYRYLRPWLGFSAGWMFLCAKTASAAAAALGFSGYLLSALGQDAAWLPYLAAATVAVMVIVVLAGIRTSSRVNIVIVSITLFALLAFVVAGAPEVDPRRLRFTLDLQNLPRATALMFVAYTGYGRIATLGEEVVEPQRTIPRAIIATLVISMALYLVVATVYVGSTDAAATAHKTVAGQQAAPLELAARSFSLNVHWLIAVGAMTAMLGVLLNLLLGLSRVVLAMGRRGDMPRCAAKLSIAVLAVGAVIAGMAFFGNIKSNWSFSAFTVLVYYAVTNLAAIRLPSDQRLFSPVWAWGGLVACAALAFSVDRKVWILGVALLAAGLMGHWLRRLCCRSDVDANESVL
jgi:APA family basic amino acid/polyamine antiporter